MASNNKQPVSAQKASICERSVLKMSHDEIKKRISVTHSRTDQKFDVGNLFAVVRNILHPAFTTVENIVYGTKQSYVGNPGESGLEVSFIPPLCLLKQLSCEMACKNPGEKTAYDTTMSILNKLKDYSWDAKAVLTLAAFALDYGEFWHFAQFYSSDQLTKSMGILKRVPIVLIPQSIEKYRNPIIALTNLIRNTLAVIECIFNLEQRFTKLDLNDEPTLSTAKDCYSVDVFWAIITIVDCMARMCCLATDWDRTQELLPFSVKISTTLDSLKEQREICKQIEAKREAYSNLKRFLQSPHDIVEVFKKLFFAEDSTYSTEDGQKDTTFPNELVISRTEELKTKNVLLLFSDLDISEEDVSILKPIHKEITKKGQYKIVWIPIVEQWMQSKYVMLQSKMEWYIVPHFSSVSGIKYIKEEWKFKNKPIIVVLNEEGTVKHQDAFHMIKTWGIEAFPFDVKREKELCKSEDWFGLSMINFSPNNKISTWYIFFYGGEDEWIAQFHQEATRVNKDLVMGGGKIFIELFGVGKDGKGKDGKGKDDLGIFWNNIENFYNSQKVIELETKTKEIQKLLSYKNEKGWVVLCKGARLVFSGYGTTVLTIFQKFDEWKLLIQQGRVFEECLLTQYNDKGKLPCRDFQVRTSAGHLTHSEKCADCSEIMEMYIRFRCCHKHHSTKAEH
ncbi:protein sieve element occlusion b [Quercus suber]|uniref:Protein sieve element occlusion b n=1 Tax=Quercus suber TaxID=58331 RepID=A0AAW0M2R3_QUESU